MFYHNTPKLCIFFFDTFIRIGRVPVGGCAGLMLFIINVLWKEIIGFGKKKIPKLMLVSARWKIVRHLSKTGWALLGLSGDFCDKYSTVGRVWGGYAVRSTRSIYHDYIYYHNMQSWSRCTQPLENHNAFFALTHRNKIN